MSSLVAATPKDRFLHRQNSRASIAVRAKLKRTAKWRRRSLASLVSNLWHSPSQKGKVRWGAKHSPPADMSIGRQQIWKQMMERPLQLRMQKKPQTNHNQPVQRSFTLQPLLATAWQDDVYSTAYHQAVNHTLQKPSNLQRSK